MYWDKVKERIARNTDALKKKKELLRKKKKLLADRKKSASKNYPAKSCLICGTSFKPSTYKTRFCGDPCRFRYLSLKSKGWTDEMIFNKGVLKDHPDRLRLENDRVILTAIKNSPDLSKKVAVVIDHKTTIFIDPWKDPQKARLNFLNRFSSL